jgi:glycyl-tRNA synthetase
MQLLAGKDLLAIVRERKDRIKIGDFDVPIDCFEVKEEKVKESGSKFVPHVIEPSFGVERLIYATLEHSLKIKDDRTIFSLPIKLAPVQASVYPLVNRDGLEEKAAQIHKSLLADGFRVEYDDAGSIGRRYARADEAGIPVGITVDYETLKDNTVTLRDRDSWQQIRAPSAELGKMMAEISNKGFPTA